MKVVCARCGQLNGEVSPLKDTRVSHGLCREDALRSYVEQGTATPEERAELRALLAEDAHGVLLVPVRARLHRRLLKLLAVLGKVYPHITLSDIVAVALTRELNRLGAQETPETVVAIYQPLPLSFFADDVAELSQPVDGSMTTAAAAHPQQESPAE